jgi:hypothetical protein
MTFRFIDEHRDRWPVRLANENRPTDARGAIAPLSTRCQPLADTATVSPFFPSCRASPSGTIIPLPFPILRWVLMPAKGTLLMESPTPEKDATLLTLDSLVHGFPNIPPREGQ